MLEKIKENVYFAYIKELEYIVTLSGALADNLDGQLCREIYSPEFIQEIKQTNQEILEIMNTTKLGGFEFIEFLMYYRGEFTLQKYKQYILDLPILDYVYQFFGYEVSREDIQKALNDESYLSKLYTEGKFHMKSYINLKHIIFHREEIVEQYFKCIESIRTPALENYLDHCQKQIEPLNNQIKHLLIDHTPQEVCDEFKKYSPRCKVRDFSNYCFIPVFMLPRNVVTYHDNTTNILLYSNTKITKQEEALLILKVISDDTRLKIIDYISENNCKNGKMLAQYLRLAPSTVSHHMEQLISCGLLKEEKIGTTKTYSIVKEKAQEFLDELEGILMKNELR